MGKRASAKPKAAASKKAKATTDGVDVREAPGDAAVGEGAGAAASVAAVVPELPGDDDADVVASDVDPNVCFVCKKAVTDDDYVVVKKASATTWEVRRCGQCNRLNTRIRKQLTKNPELQDSWQQLSKTEKHEFFLKNHSALGDNLKLLINECVTHSHETTSAADFGYTSEWLDEVDLAERFKNKPGQLEAIKANAQSFTCSVRGVALFEVKTYRAGSMDTTTATKKRDVAMSTASQLKAVAGAPRAKREARETTISDAQVAKIEKILGEATTAAKNVDAFLEANKADKDMPAILFENLVLKVANVMESIASGKLVLELKRGKTSEVINSIKESVGVMDESYKKLKAMADDLKSIRPPPNVD